MTIQESTELQSKSNGDPKDVPGDKAFQDDRIKQLCCCKKK
jgi:hypothetical protein